MDDGVGYNSISDQIKWEKSKAKDLLNGFNQDIITEQKAYQLAIIFSNLSISITMKG